MKGGINMIDFLASLSRKLIDCREKSLMWWLARLVDPQSDVGGSLVLLAGVIKPNRNRNSTTGREDSSLTEVMTYAGKSPWEASLPTHLLTTKTRTRIVELLMSTEAPKALMAWEPVSPRLMSARFNANGRKIAIIQCYAPTNEAEEEEKEDFYSSLQSVLDHTPRRDLKIIMGDLNKLNAKVGDDNTNTGRHGVGTCNENGELFTDFCDFNDHVIEHQLLVEVFKIKLKSFTDLVGRPHHKFNTQNLKKKETREIYNCEVRNKYRALSGLTEESVEEHWSTLKRIWKTTCTDVLGKRERKHKEWMTPEIWAKIESRKGLQQKLNQCQDQLRKEDLRAEYWEANGQVQSSVREDKRRFIHELTEEAETAARQGNMKRLYEITKTLSGRNINQKSQ
ncbi:hypothetical protein C0Q70_18397 [Pomacea canaliculata]|uniref:Endonuclease/exonuclease/phosphatase domain-containing protein n=1 Tax=Pomacea canaliculata TaxID=400727 RepID=A0A2T7NN29_POMCA|nr:hypothetical protein C0Q70_18397 [Pomacea canaliculata]